MKNKIMNLENKILECTKTKERFLVLDKLIMVGNENESYYRYQEFKSVPKEHRKIFIDTELNIINNFNIEPNTGEKNITFYYGISGTFKTTTIHVLNETLPVSNKLYTSTKLWKQYETGVFNGLVPEPCDLIYAINHLCRLKEFKTKHPFHDLIIERGVSDMVFFHHLRGNKLRDEKIEEIINLELEKTEDRKVSKILLIQKDKKFIHQNIILKTKESSRKEWFVDVEDYLRKQDDYVEFTKKYNNITDVIEILDVRDYLESITLEYNEKEKE